MMRFWSARAGRAPTRQDLSQQFDASWNVHFGRSHCGVALLLSIPRFVHVLSPWRLKHFSLFGAGNIFGKRQSRRVCIFGFRRGIFQSASQCEIGTLSAEQRQKQLDSDSGQITDLSRLIKIRPPMLQRASINESLSNHTSEQGLKIISESNILSCEKEYRKSWISVVSNLWPNKSEIRLEPRGWTGVLMLEDGFPSWKMWPRSVS